MSVYIHDNHVYFQQVERKIFIFIKKKEILKIYFYSTSVVLHLLFSSAVAKSDVPFSIRHIQLLFSTSCCK